MALPGVASPQAPLSAFAVHKAETLLREQLPCLGCHALGSDGGRLAPDLLTVRERRSVAYIAAMVDDPQRLVPGSLMPRLTMAPATRDLIVRYLQTRPGTGATPPAGAARAVPDAGGPALYGRWCAPCHGASGRGDGLNASRLPVTPAAHASAASMSARSDDALYDTIASGGAIMNRSPRMPAFGETLTPPQIRALVAEIRRLCRCEGPAWSR
ncbi:MAG: c-type cytochrome [Gemmatimonadaceae bacterium]|nr:c-type cytochrome [Gemmatimonadaceae bacterium]